jgi:hypothetical protein
VVLVLMKAKLDRRIDSWLLADDFFFAGGRHWMTYSPERDDLGPDEGNRREVRFPSYLMFGAQ